MEIDLEIHTSDHSLVSHIMGSSDAVTGSKVELADDVTLCYDQPFPYRDVDMLSIFFFVLSIPIGIATSMVAQKILDRLEGRDKTARVKFSYTRTVEQSDMQETEELEIDIAAPDADAQLAEFLAKAQRSAV